MQMAQQKQQQMQRDPSNQDGQQRAQSPGSAENAPSPSKRPRLDPNFNAQQQMPNGRGQGMPQQVGDSGPSNVQAAHMQLNGLEPNLTAQQFQPMPGGNSTAQARSLGAYQANLAQQQQSQMPGAKGAMQNPGGPQSQGSPMMGAGRDGPGIADYYNPQDPNMRGGAAGQPGQPGSNHALQDYQMQLMLLEQQNKKRLMMARQEQDSMSSTGIPRADGSQGPPQMGPNGQQQFAQGTSPQGPRSVNSPNPNEQMKRGNPNMPGGMPSPLPEGQSRGSPNNGMGGFNLPNGPMDPNMNPQYFAKMGGMGDPNMVPGGVMPNGMRPPPSSHPGNGFNNGQPMNPQHAAMLRAQQQQAQAAQQQGGWQGPNGQMVQQPQGGPQQGMVGAPQQQRAMPPPSAPTPTLTNGRTQPSSPQQPAPPTPQANNKPAPKKKNTETKETKAKVYLLALNGFSCRNVDIDNSVPLKRRDPLQTTLVLHHPPKTQPVQRQPLKHLSLPSILLIKFKMVLSNLLTVKHLLNRTLLLNQTCSMETLATTTSQ